MPISSGYWMATPVNELIPEETRKTMQERSDWGDLLTSPIYQQNIPVQNPAETRQSETQ